jgi:tetratricopeptide (TPR) repeat protein
VREEVVAALDHWASITRDESRREWLLAVARAADPDPERNSLRQPELWRDRAALSRRVREARVAELSPQLAAALGVALLASGGDAVPLLREAQARHPHDFWLNVGLGKALYQANEWDEAIGYYRAALALRPRAASAHVNLGVALEAKGKVDEAVGHYEEALRLDPKHALAHYNLGHALYGKGKVDEAVGHYQETLRLEPKLAPAHVNLGLALKTKGQLNEAIRHYEEALRLDLKLAPAHSNLGLALAAKGQLDEAIRHSEEALRLDPKDALAHYNLGLALCDKGQLDEAIRHSEEAIRLDPKLAPAHVNLGNALKDKGKVDEAVGHYEQALRIDPKCAEAHCNLGHALRDQGDFEGALACLKRGHELGAKRPDWRYPSAEWVRDVERLIALDGKLPAILRGEARPADPAEQLGLARLCALKKRHAAAARFFAEAFAAQPKPADDLQTQDRYNAACAAALAAAGQGVDADKLGDGERARLRRQALEWLTVDLAAWEKRMNDQPQERARVQQTLRHWKEDRDLVGIRETDALAQLPPGERDACRKLWADVDVLLQQVHEK